MIFALTAEHANFLL